MSRDEKHIVIKTKYVKYGCITMAIILLIAAIGTGIWLHQQLNASGRVWHSRMQALRDQSIMKTSWPGIELLTTEETKYEGFEPKQPNITNFYKLTIPPEDARRLILETAAKDGWTENPTIGSPQSTGASKRIDSLSVTLIISETNTYSKYPGASLYTSIFHQ